MSTDELLLQLREIAPPGEPDWWPLAPGWWMLIAIGVASILVLLILLKRRYGSRSFRLANRELERISRHNMRCRDNQYLVLNLSRWLRQVSLMAFPERKIAGITGLAWLEILDEVMDKSEFRQGPGKIFARSVYSRQPDFNDTMVLELCESWVTSIKPRLNNKDRGHKC